MGRSTQRYGTRNQGVCIDVSEQKGIRYLHLDHDDVQSAMRVKSPTELVLAYSRTMMGVLLFNDTPQTAVLLGLGGGSLVKFIYHYLPQVQLQVAELHPEVIAAARAWFFLPDDDARLQVHAIDGAVFVPRLAEPVDLIFHDAFSASGIVQTLVDDDFLRQCYDKLTLDGILVLNLWSSDKYTPLYIDRVRTIFADRVLELSAFPDKNRIIYAFKRSPKRVEWHALKAQAKQLQQSYPLDFSTMVSAMTAGNRHTEKRLLLR